MFLHLMLSIVDINQMEFNRPADKSKKKKRLEPKKAMPPCSFSINETSFPTFLIPFYLLHLMKHSVTKYPFHL